MLSAVPLDNSTTMDEKSIDWGAKAPIRGLNHGLKAKGLESP